MKAEDRLNRRTKLRYWAHSIIMALLLSFFIRTTMVAAFTIPSESMVDTLLVGDFLLVNKMAYGIKAPLTDVILVDTGQYERGDIVVFDHPLSHETFIKRVVGLSGDILAMRDKVLYLNGKEYPEPYVRHGDPRIIPVGGPPRDNWGPIKVPPGHLFMLGDNRDFSWDSRFWGTVDHRLVKGEAFIVLMSLDLQTYWPRWSRFGDLL